MSSERPSKLSIAGAILMALSWIAVPVAQVESARNHGFAQLGVLVVYFAFGAIVAGVGVGLAIAGIRSKRRTVWSRIIFGVAILMLVPIGFVVNFCFTALS
jgi:hypothetical protein